MTCLVILAEQKKTMKESSPRNFADTILFCSFCLALTLSLTPNPRDTLNSPNTAIATKCRCRNLSQYHCAVSCSLAKSRVDDFLECLRDGKMDLALETRVVVN